MQRRESRFEYLLTFSSFYKAMYARDKLMERGITARMQRAPTQLLRSCGQALYVPDCELQQILAILSENQINTKGIYEKTGTENKPEYRQIR